MHQRLISKITETSNKSNWNNFQPRRELLKRKGFKKKFGCKAIPCHFRSGGLYVQIP